MIKYLPFFFFLFLALSVAAPMCADDALKKFYGKRIGTAVTRTETKRQYDFTGRPFAPSDVRAGRDIVIDRQGRRIGLVLLVTLDIAYVIAYFLKKYLR